MDLSEGDLQKIKLRLDRYTEISATKFQEGLFGRIEKTSKHGARWLIVHKGTALAILLPLTDVKLKTGLPANIRMGRRLLQSNRVDTAKAFVNRALRPAPEGKALEKQALYQQYEAWCANLAIEPLPPTHFGRAVCAVVPDIQSDRVMQDGRRIWAYRDVMMITLDEMEAFTAEAWEEEEKEEDGHGESTPGLPAGWKRGTHRREPIPPGEPGHIAEVWAAEGEGTEGAAKDAAEVPDEASGMTTEEKLAALWPEEEDDA